MIKKYKLLTIFLSLSFLYLWFFTDDDSFIENVQDLLALITVLTPLLPVAILYLKKTNPKDITKPRQIHFKSFVLFVLILSAYMPIGMVAFRNYLMHHNPLLFDTNFFHLLILKWSNDKLFFLTTLISNSITLLVSIPFIFLLNRHLRKKHAQKQEPADKANHNQQH